MNQKELEEKAKELQILEQNLQSFMMQKQTLQVELNEIFNALAELEKTHDEVYKVLGGIMVRAERPTLIKELTERKKPLELRIASIEKQEKLISDKSEKLRKEINSIISSGKK